MRRFFGQMRRVDEKVFWVDVNLLCMDEKVFWMDEKVFRMRRCLNK
jgi:hypothetical protein